MGSLRNLKYFSILKEYQTGLLEVTDQNNGKFKVIETKNPEGYTGSWSKEVIFTKGGTSEQNISLTATNKKIENPKGTVSVVKKRCHYPRDNYSYGCSIPCISV